MNGGNGANSVTVDSTAATGFIAGNTQITLGSGTNTVSVGTKIGLTEKGSLSVSSRGAGASSLQVLGSTTAAGSVLGSTTIAGVPNVNLGNSGGIGKADVFAGNVTINNAGNSQAETIVLFSPAKDLGNFTVQGGQGSTVVESGGSILGTAALKLGNGSNFVGLTGAGIGGPPSIGNLIDNGGNGSNNFGVGGSVTVLGNAAMNWGNGREHFELLWDWDRRPHR